MGAASSQMALGSDQLVDELSDRVLHVGVMSHESVATGCNRHELGSWDAGGSLKGVPIRRERVVLGVGTLSYSRGKRSAVTLEM
jgi:hypothetical protein